VISGWQESYLGSYDRSSVDCVPGDTLAPDFGSAIGYKRGWSYQGPPELLAGDGRALGGTGIGGASDIGAGGTDIIDGGWEW
jgi:hypothetical protein